MLYMIYRRFIDLSVIDVSSLTDKSFAWHPKAKTSFRGVRGVSIKSKKIYRFVNLTKLHFVRDVQQNKSFTLYYRWLNIIIPLLQRKRRKRLSCFYCMLLDYIPNIPSVNKSTICQSGMLEVDIYWNLQYRI